MNLSLSILLDQLPDLQCEVHVPDPQRHTFRTAALLPRNYDVMRSDLIHVCRLSDALWASDICPGMYYLCIRDRIADSSESEERLSGMVILTENMDVELLLSKVQDIFVNVREWYIHMQEALIQEQSLQTILDLSAGVIGNTINISDSAFSMLACTQNIETDDTVSLNLRTLGYHPESTLKLFREQNRLEAYNQAQSLILNESGLISPYTLVSKVFRFRNTYFTHVVMVCDHRPLSPGLLELFQLLTGVLAIYAERNWKDKNAFSHNYDSLIGDILARKLTKREDIVERADYLGLNAAGQFVLLKLTVETGKEPVLGRIGRELLDRFPDAQVVLYEAAVLALFHVWPGQSGTDWLRGPIEELLLRHQARGGFSRLFSGLENLPSAYTQASLALKYSAQMKGRELLASLMPEPEPSSLYTYQERMLHILLGEYEGNETIWKSSVYYTALKTLHDYDIQHSTNNLQLLRVYLWYERKVTETGQKLHMHRNSVIYRISRIETMIGLDLDDYRTRLALQMSFLLLELYGFPTEDADTEEKT